MYEEVTFFMEARRKLRRQWDDRTRYGDLRRKRLARCQLDERCFHPQCESREHYWADCPHRNQPQSEDSEPQADEPPKKKRKWTTEYQRKSFPRSTDADERWNQSDAKKAHDRSATKKEKNQTYNSGDKKKDLDALRNKGDKKKALNALHNKGDKKEALNALHNKGDKKKALDALRNKGDKKKELNALHNKGDRKRELDKVYSASQMKTDYNTSEEKQESNRKYARTETGKEMTKLRVSKCRAKKKAAAAAAQQPALG